MSWRSVKSESYTLTHAQAISYVNDELGTSYSDVSAATIAAGLGTVAYALATVSASPVTRMFGALTMAVGWAIAYEEFRSKLYDDYLKGKLREMRD